MLSAKASRVLHTDAKPLNNVLGTASVFLHMCLGVILLPAVSQPVIPAVFSS